MGWFVLLALALALFAALWRFASLERTGLQLVAAALLFALAGYAWQGRPGLAGSPRSAAEPGEVPETAFTAMRGDLLGRFDTADRWLTMAESYMREGDTHGAAQILATSVRLYPNNAVLWIGYANALVVHARGMMTPAAELAFRRAAALAPDHPGPRFFYGMALAQSGRLDEGEAAWRALLASPSLTPKWRTLIEEQLALVDRARAMAAQQGR